MQRSKRRALRRRATPARFSRSLPGLLRKFLPLRLARYQTEAEVRHRVVGIAAAPRARAVAQAVVDVAEERAAADHALRRIRRRAAVVGVVALARAFRVEHLGDLRLRGEEI